MRAGAEVAGAPWYVQHVRRFLLLPALLLRFSAGILALGTLLVACGGTTISKAPVDDSGATKTACVPGQSVACVGPGGCATNQVCNPEGSAFGPCDCPDAATFVNDAGELPDGYAPIPTSLGTQGYNAIWAVNPLSLPSQGWIFRPLFSVPDCAAVPPYGDSYVALFAPTSAGPSGTFPVCSQSGTGGPMPCYDSQVYTYATGDSSYQVVPGGKLVVSDFNGDGIATGYMDTIQGIVPLVVKNCP